jgi:hypothetical protein
MSEKKPEADPEIPWITKLRSCLMCGSSFRSLWAGERVCSKCKTTRDWRTGDASMSGESPASSRPAATGTGGRARRSG